jgi:hypothetical protein
VKNLSIKNDTIGFIKYDNLDKLANFNCSHERPADVVHFCEALKKAYKVLFITPEYTFWYSWCVEERALTGLYLPVSL